MALLTTGVCIVLFIRHGVHAKKSGIKNVLDPAAVQQARQRGRWLQGIGVTISAATASPMNRAHSTVENLLIGTAPTKLLPIRTKDEIGDLGMDPDMTTEAVDALKAAAAEAGIEPEEYIIQDPASRDMMVRRGREGATCLREFAAQNPGKVVVAGSHGGSRMEVTIAALADDNFTPSEIPAEDLIPRGEIVALVLKSGSGKLIRKVNLW